jgi:alpha-galactosidase
MLKRSHATAVFLLLFAANVSRGHAQNQHWELATDDTRIGLDVVDNQLLIARLENATARHNWAGRHMAVPLMAKVWINGRELPVLWTFVNAQEDRHSGRLILRFSNAEPMLSLKSIWRARPGRGPIEHWIDIENQTGQTITVSQQDSLSLSGLQIDRPANLWWIKRGGSNASTQGGTFTEPIVAGRDLILSSNCMDGASPVPWLAVQAGDQHGLYVGWEFSGLGRVHAKVGDSPSALTIEVGNHPDFKTDVEPHEVFHVPPAFVGCYAGDIDEGSYSLHRFILEKLRPRVPAGYADPTLAYNLYLDAGGNHATEADVLRCVHSCHDIGFETFVPDAMWFPETGDWRWDPARFPRGIGPIEQAVHSSGMKLALWCAWTNGGVSADPGALSILGPQTHRDWFNADVPADWKPAPFSGALLCLGCDEAKDWAIKKTQWLVQHHKLDYLKHDMNPIVTTCDRTTHRHKYGVDTSYWAALGYYEVYDKLLAANPSLMLENCSAGGHTKDFGVIQRSHYTVTTDTLSNLPDRQSIYDSTFAFPPLVLQAYTYDNFYPVEGDEPGPFLWRSAMMSAWQIDPTDTFTWTDAQRDSAKRAADIYKEWIRPMLADVKVHHILPRPDGVHWDGMFYFSETAKRGMLYVFRPDSPDAENTIRLKGLAPDQSYWIWSEDASVPPGVRTGAQLIKEGLTIALANRYSSELVYVQESSLGKPPGLDAPGEFRLGHAEASSGPFAASATLRWDASANARRYRVKISSSSDFHDMLVDAYVTRPVFSSRVLPPGRELYWKVEANSWGGKRGSSGDAARFNTPPLQELSGVSFVSDLKWLSATAGAGNITRRDTNLQGKTIAIARSQYEKGIWTHAFADATPADIVIDISDQHFDQFRADSGVEDSADCGSVQFQVLVDGKLKAESPIMGPGAVHHFDVAIGGANQITLRVLNGGDGYNCDHSAWGYARLLQKGASDPLQQ